MVKERIGNERRKDPFIIKCGELYHLAADGKIFIDSIKSSMEALVMLLATYYTFHIQWCKQIHSTFLFMEKVLLEKDPINNAMSSELRLFLEKVSELKKSNGSAD